jgi:plastocyanin
MRPEGTVPDVRWIPRSIVPLALLLGGAAACSDDDGDGASSRAGRSGEPRSEDGCAIAEDGAVTLVADDLAWDVPCIEAPAGEELQITVDNRDDGVSHNLHFTDLPGEPATSLQGGPVTQSLSFGAPLPPGEHPYVCDIHPTMTGTLEVVEPGSIMEP